jgi:hypothetical protein
MNSLVFLCEICEHTFSSQRGLKSHITRSHNNEISSTICGKCNRDFSTRSNRYKHEKKCGVNNVEDTVKELVKEVKMMKEKQSQPQIINNITHNNITHNNVSNYNGNTYTQNNTNILTSGLDNLKPITRQIIIDQMKQMFIEATQEKKLFLTPKDLGEKMSNNVFKGSLLTTDLSRGTIHWKDGDDNNKPIKDPQCAILSSKMYHALIDKKDEVIAPYSDYIDMLTNNINQDTGFERSNDLQKSRHLLDSLSEEDTMKIVGKALSKAPIIPCIKQTFKLEKFQKILKDFYRGKPYIFMFQDSHGVGTSIKKALEAYGDFSANLDELTLKDDDNKKIKISTSSFFDIIKESFNSIPNYIFIFLDYYLDFPHNFETIKIFVESKDIARTNSKIFEKWINNELNTDDQKTFEQKILRMLSLKC